MRKLLTIVAAFILGLVGFNSSASSVSLYFTTDDWKNYDDPGNFVWILEVGEGLVDHNAYFAGLDYSGETTFQIYPEEIGTCDLGIEWGDGSIEDFNASGKGTIYYDDDEGRWYMILNDSANGEEFTVTVYPFGEGPSTGGGSTITEVDLNFSISGDGIAEPNKAFTMSYFDLNNGGNVNIDLSSTSVSATVPVGKTIEVTPVDGYVISEIFSFATGTVSISEPSTEDGVWSIYIPDSPQEDSAFISITVANAPANITLNFTSSQLNPQNFVNVVWNGKAQPNLEATGNKLYLTAGGNSTLVVNAVNTEDIAYNITGVTITNGTTQISASEYASYGITANGNNSFTLTEAAAGLTFTYAVEQGQTGPGVPVTMIFTGTNFAGSVYEKVNIQANMTTRIVPTANSFTYDIYGSSIDFQFTGVTGYTVESVSCATSTGASYGDITSIATGGYQLSLPGNAGGTIPEGLVITVSVTETQVAAEANVTFYFRDGQSEVDDFEIGWPGMFVTIFDDTKGEIFIHEESAMMAEGTFAVPSILKIYPSDIDYEIVVTVTGDEDTYILTDEDGEYYLTLLEGADDLEVAIAVYLQGFAPGSGTPAQTVEVDFTAKAAMDSGITNPGQYVTVWYFENGNRIEKDLTSTAELYVPVGTTITVTPAQGYVVSEIAPQFGEENVIAESFIDDNEWTVYVKAADAFFTNLWVYVDYAPAEDLALTFEDFGMVIDPMSDAAVTTEVPVSIEPANMQPYLGFQFDFTLPEGLEVSKVALGEGLAGSITFASRDDNTYRVISYLEWTENGYTQTENIAVITVATSEDVKIAGSEFGTEYDVTISNVIFSDMVGLDIKTVSGSEGTVTIYTKEYPATDVEITSVTIIEPSYSSSEMVDEVTQGEELEVTVTVTPSYTTDDVTLEADVEGVEITDNGDGTFTVNFDDVVIPEGGEIEITITATAGDQSDSYTFTLKGILLGDSNDNGVVTVADVVTTANYIVNKDVADFCFPNANVILTEVNGQQVINDSDLAATIDIVLDVFSGNRNPMNAKRHTRNMASNDQLVIDGFRVEANAASTIGVNLENSNSYVTLQARVVIPEGMIVYDVTAGPRAANHDIAFNVVDNNLYVVIYSLRNEKFADGEGALFNMTVSASEDCGNITIEDIHASDASYNGYDLGFEGGRNVTGTTGINGIDADEAGVRYYTVDGIEVANPQEGQILIRVAGDKVTKVIK